MQKWTTHLKYSLPAQKHQALILVTASLVLTLLAGVKSLAGELSRDEFFVVASKNLMGFTGFEAPSVNDIGDIVVRSSSSAGTEHRVFFVSDQYSNPNMQGRIPNRVARSSSQTLSRNPLINNNRSIVSHHSFTGGNQNIYRLDYDGVNFSSTVIAQGQVSQVQPFTLLAPIAGIDDSIPAEIYFYGERTPPSQPQNRRIYGSTTEVTRPSDATPLASYPDVFSTLDQYVAASHNGRVVYRGTKAGQLGIYKGSQNAAVAIPLLGFSTTGTRPTVNTKNTIAFYGIYQNVSPQLARIFLQFDTENTPRVTGNFAAGSVPSDLLVTHGDVPPSYSSSSRIALNDYNQVAYLGVDPGGNLAIFTTALGINRKLVSVGDTIQQISGAMVTVTSLSLFDGLGIKGQVTFMASTSDGDQLILVANRAYNQRTTLYSPIVPSYFANAYLLYHVSGSGFPNANHPAKTIGQVGCNLTSTANILNFYGAVTSPITFQNWLKSRWQVEPAETRVNYIDPNNDFPDAVVEEYSQYLISQGNASRVVRHRAPHSVARGSNVGKIISEVRSGRAVKLRVPSSTQYGHFIVAYGIIDPTKLDAQITKSDILIADPGKNVDFTLAEYGQLERHDETGQGTGQTYDQFYGLNWIEDEDAANGLRRVYLFDTLPQSSVSISGYSPIQMILRDSLGRRAGFSSATGVLTEIPGSDYYAETSYYTLDEDGVASQPAWGSDESVKHIFVNDVAAGSFTLDLLGTGTGSYTVSIRGNGGLVSDTPLTTGSINAGDRRTIAFNIQTVRPRFLEPYKLPDGSLNWTIVGDPQKAISVETSTNLANWTLIPGLQLTNGIGVINVATTNGPLNRFLRAYQ